MKKIFKFIGIITIVGAAGLIAYLCAPQIPDLTKKEKHSCYAKERQQKKQQAYKDGYYECNANCKNCDKGVCGC